MIITVIFANLLLLSLHSVLHCTAMLSVYSQNANVAWEQLKYREPLNENHG